MGNSYDGDVAAWAYEQAAHLRNHNWTALDIDNIAEEIESVARAEENELGRHLAELLAAQLRWKLQKNERHPSWARLMDRKRSRIQRFLKQMPSLQPLLSDFEWFQSSWHDALLAVAKETSIEGVPLEPIWTVEQVLNPDFLPDLDHDFYPRCVL